MPNSPENENGAPVEAPEASDERLKELEGRNADLDDRYKRALADLDNYRKRSAREADRRVAEARERTVGEWLEAVDAVERALRMESPVAVTPLAAGLKAVLEQMKQILARQGVERVGAPGESFDPELHEAIGVQENDGVPDRTILDVSRSGYRTRDGVLRPAQVIVARRPESQQTD
jgi:molecular chaperone GrpE